MAAEDNHHRKRPLPDATDTTTSSSSSSSSSSKRPKPDVAEDGNPDAEEDDVLLSWLTLDDEDVAQLMDFLSPSPHPAAAAVPEDAPSLSSQVRFAENPRDDARLEVIRSSSSFITIDLNEESCGSSFSEFESSVMASFDRCGYGGGSLVASAAERAFWYAWTGISSGGEAVVVSGGTQCGGDDVPELPWDGEGGLGF